MIPNLFSILVACFATIEPFEHVDVPTLTVAPMLFDCHSREQMQPLINALVQIYECEGNAPTGSKAIAREALDYAGTLGF